MRTAAALAEHGARVTLACRDSPPGEQAAARIRRAQSDAPTSSSSELELASMAAIRAFAEQWSGPLDLLVNNAGVMAPPRFARTADGFELQFGTNHLGHYVLTGLLLPALLRAIRRGRVVTVSSIVHHRGTEAVLDGNAGPGYDPQQAYAESKLANLLFALELQRRSSRRRPAAHVRRRTSGHRGDRAVQRPRGHRRQAGGAPARAARCCDSSRSRRRQAHGRPCMRRRRLRPARTPDRRAWARPAARIGPARLSTLAQDEQLGARTVAGE